MNRTQRSYLAAGATGAAAGTLAATVQSAVGLAIDRLFLPPGHDNNIAPRLVNRTIRRAGKPSHPVLDWTLGLLFHYGYGLGWGAAFGVVRRGCHLPSLPLGAILGGALYALAFSRVGVGTRTGTERHPRWRPWRKQVSLVAIPLVYSLSLALLYDRLAPAVGRQLSATSHQRTDRRHVPARLAGRDRGLSGVG